MRVAIATLLLCFGCAQRADWPGENPDGTIRLPNGWSLAPHGQQFALAHDLPLRLAWHPGGRFLAIQHAGYRTHGVTLFDTETGRVVAEHDLGRSWSGMCWSPDGARLYVSGGVDDVLHELAFTSDPPAFATARVHAIGVDGVLDVPAGPCCSRAGQVFVSLQRGDALVSLAASGELAWSVPLPRESFACECALTPDERTVLVSLQGKKTVQAHDATTGAVRWSVETGEHPSEMLVTPDGARLFVSCGNENTVSVIDLDAHRVEETLGSALFPDAPPGSTPNSLALSANGKVLLVANADNNDCAVLDVSDRRASKGLGFIPLGWYPTAIRFAPDGRRVFVANGKGGRSRANPGLPGPVPGRDAGDVDYTGAMFTGTLEVFAFPPPEELGTLTQTAYRCAPLTAGARVRELDARPRHSPIPARPGDPSPITHVVYIVKENRTYDQVLGDDARGNGDASICLFPEQVTPNHHAIAREFVLLDNCYVESEVSADGHEWSFGAYANDWIERTWPVDYGGRGSKKQKDGKTLTLGYPGEGAFAMARPKHGYLWDLARQAGITFRVYGIFTQQENGVATTKLDSLRPHVDPHYRGFDMGYSDQLRADRFLAELARFEREGAMPRLCIVQLPNDHTAGTAPGTLTPRALVADNDLALGRILEGLSRSPFWRSLAVFVVEDDAQNGPDHVDAHRAVAFVAGPHVKRGVVVSAMYSTCSVLRTIELILGLPPMSQFDAAARPMFACFQDEPDLTPYRAHRSTWPLDERNQTTAWGTELSRTFDLARADAADDLLLNEIVWRSVRGAESPMPAPRRAAFVRVLDE